MRAFSFRSIDDIPYGTVVVVLGSIVLTSFDHVIRSFADTFIWFMIHCVFLFHLSRSHGLCAICNLFHTDHLLDACCYEKMDKYLNLDFCKQFDKAWPLLTPTIWVDCIFILICLLSKTDLGFWCYHFNFVGFFCNSIIQPYP